MSLREQLERMIEAARQDDPELEKELQGIAGRPSFIDLTEGMKSRMEGRVEGADALATVGARFRVARPSLNPVFSVSGGKVVLTFPDAESKVWKERLEAASDILVQAVQAVGRFEVDGRFGPDEGGTGVMVGEDVLATNAHVAGDFVSSQTLTFKPKFFGAGNMEPFIDFTEQPDGAKTGKGTRNFRIVKVLHLGKPGGPDLALLRLEPVAGITAGPIPPHLVLADESPPPGRFVAAVGYPEEEVSAANAADLARIFNGVFDTKRVAPGRIVPPEDGSVKHDCSVLTGNSGAPIVDLETGKVVAINFAGSFPGHGFAVPAPLIVQALQKLKEADDAEDSGPAEALVGGVPAAVRSGSRASIAALSTGGYAPAN
jgi:hypothetical protein